MRSFLQIQFEESRTRMKWFSEYYFWKFLEEWFHAWNIFCKKFAFKAWFHRVQLAPNEILKVSLLICLWIQQSGCCIWICRERLILHKPLWAHKVTFHNYDTSVFESVDLLKNEKIKQIYTFARRENTPSCAKVFQGRENTPSSMTKSQKFKNVRYLGRILPWFMHFHMFQTRKIHSCRLALRNKKYMKTCARGQTRVSEKFSARPVSKSNM